MALSAKKTKLLHQGIGKKYHDKSLTSYDHPVAQEVVTWLENDSPRHFNEGSGILFTGNTAEGYDIAILTSRALILSEMKLYREDFIDLLDYETIQQLWDTKSPLTITNFSPDSRWVNPEAYKRLENLLNYYLDNGIIFNVHLPVDEENPDYGDLMSPVFLDRLKKNNKKFQIN